jgi:membrane protease YdiL (CAAX protease family)
LGTLRPTFREPLLTFLAAIALASGLFWLGRVEPFVHRNLHALIAVVFFYAPVVAGRLTGRPFDFHEAGLRLDPIRTNAAVLALAIAVTFPLFIVGFFLFYGAVCGPPHPGWGDIGPLLGRLCPGSLWLGWTGGHLRFPASFALLAANQVLVIALPEELFFRGYLLGRLEARWPSRWRLAGAPVGWPLLASALLFALGHFLVDFNPQRLAVFFPALVFGWLRARTGSIAAGTAFHASCNLLADVMHTSFF